MTMHARALALAALATLGATLNAEAQSGFAGKWAFDIPVRVENGEVTETAPAVLTIELKGDSVHGTWTVRRPNGEMGDPVPARGKVTAGTAKFLVGPIIGRINENGEVREIKMTSEWTATLEKGELMATVVTKGEDGNGPPPRKMTGKRAN